MTTISPIKLDLRQAHDLKYYGACVWSGPPDLTQKTVLVLRNEKSGETIEVALRPRPGAYFLVDENFVHGQ